MANLIFYLFGLIGTIVFAYGTYTDPTANYDKSFIPWLMIVVVIFLTACFLSEEIPDNIKKEKK